MLIEAKSLAEIENLRHGFFTRDGGVSDGIYASLNCGLGSSDVTDKVMENRRRVEACLGSVDHLVTPYQCHSADVVVTDGPWRREDLPRADGIVTNTPGLAIGVSTADCVPVLFAEPAAGIVGAAHAGWRGALAGVLEATISSMQGLGAARCAITAAIGPAISQTAYEVGEEFERNFINENAQNERFFTREAPSSRAHFDLTGYVASRLENAAIGKVEDLKTCTYREENRLFSYRRATHRAESDYGRQISAILVPRCSN
ncbi:MAG: peptidoglycan editing factor PgeF [Hyphomicrobiales bacterium]|nr:peptidoglycan editing factor PgeF [Hyphomicrobiales bacterium]